MKLKRIEVSVTETYVFVVPEDFDVESIDEKWFDENYGSLEIEHQYDGMEKEISIDEEFVLSRELSYQEESDYNNRELEPVEYRTYFDLYLI
jgi:hypothetical protein